LGGIICGTDTGSITFTGLVDTPGGYTTANALYTTDSDPNSIIETAVVLTEGTNTFNITKGTASLDIAAGSALNVDANLTVESASFINQDVTSDATPTFGGILATASTTLQNFTGVNATTTFATSTDLHLSGGLFISGDYITDFAGTNLSVTAGVLNATGDVFAWTPETAGNATSTLILFDIGLIAASSSITDLDVVNGTTTNATSTNLNVTGQVDFDTLTSALIITGAGGILAEYTGTSCSNQFTRSLSALGAATCETVSLTADVTGTLPIANGGTNATSLGSNMLLTFNGTSVIASSSPTAAMFVLIPPAKVEDALVPV